MHRENKRSTGNTRGEEADELRRLWMASTAGTAGEQKTPNPLWIDFPTKCVRTVPSTWVMQHLVEHYNASPNVMVVHYTQSNCTPCNAIGKIYEFLCQDLTRHYPRLHFYEVEKERVPEATKNMVRFPQVKAFHRGQWADIDFKPPQDFRDSAFQQVERSARLERKQGNVVSALQAEEMYFSISAPAITQIMESSIIDFYTHTQAHCHNYWKQISQRRAWFYKKYINPQANKMENQEYSAFGERPNE